MSRLFCLVKILPLCDEDFLFKIFSPLVDFVTASDEFYIKNK